MRITGAFLLAASLGLLGLVMLLTAWWDSPDV
jgi:hypothetical protein